MQFKNENNSNRLEFSYDLTFNISSHPSDFSIHVTKIKAIFLSRFHKKVLFGIKRKSTVISPFLAKEKLDMTMNTQMSFCVLLTTPHYYVAYKSKPSTKKTFIIT